MQRQRGLETNFDEDYPVTQPLNNRLEYNDTQIVDINGSRYTLHSIHSDVGGNETCGNFILNFTSLH